MSVRPQELNYALTSIPATPQIRYMQVFQNEGGQTVPIQPAGGAMSTFYCVQHSMYFDKSYLQFSFTPSSPGAITKFNWLSAEGVPYIRQFRAFLKSTGQELCNIQAFHKYCNLTMRRKTAIDDVKTRDKLFATAGTVPSGQFEVLSCSNNISTVAGAPAKRHDNSSITTSFDEPVYLASGIAGTAQPTDPGTPSVNCLIPFSAIKDSILGYDKLFVTGGQDIVFEIYWGGMNQIGWSSGSATNPADNTTTVGALAPNTGTGGSISGLRLMVATETNPEILTWANHQSIMAALSTSFALSHKLKLPLLLEPIKLLRCASLVDLESAL